jgi:hypothetical protein
MINGPKRYFSKTMYSPYFQTKHYSEEHCKAEIKIENLFVYTKNKILFWRNKNVLR